MTTLNISLPDDLKEAVESEVSRAGYSSASEYVRRLIREDQIRRAREELEAKLLEGLKGPAKELTERDWAAIRQEVAKRLSRRTAARRRKAG